MSYKTLLIVSIVIGNSKSDWAFPEYFKFGAGSSAYQVEGGWNADGKGVSIWDTLTHELPEKFADGGNGDVACDSYHKYKEDVELVKRLGVNYYRFSLSWTRIIPDGYTNNLNQAGIDYYNNLINNLIENGIEPLVTLYHFDEPQEFFPLGGLSNIVWSKFFAHYARTAFRLFGDRVKTWATFNEPYAPCYAFPYYYFNITREPIYPSGVQTYLCSYSVLKAHAAAYHIYDKEFRPRQKGRVGITLDMSWIEPASNSTEDIKAAERERQFDFGLYANPIINFGWPQIVIDRIAYRSKLEGFPESRLPVLSLADKIYIHGTIDFLGLNHYSTSIVEDIPEPPLDEHGYPIDLKVNTTSTELVPWGLRKNLNWIKKTYHNIEVIITENGYGSSGDDADTLDDTARVNYFKGYLNAVLQAIFEDKVNVRGYTAWSLLDDFEWFSAYTVKYGLHYVDFNSPNRTRIPRASAEYYKRVIATRRLD